MLKLILKKIHNFFLIFRINISLVKNENNHVSAIEHNTVESMNNFYADSKLVKNYLEPSRIKFYLKILEILKNNKIDLNGKSLVDVGCGTGHLLSFINKEYEPCRIVGYDFADDALKIARKNVPGADFSLYDIYSAQIEKFDCIFCTEVLEHLLYPDKALKNLIEMLSSSGMLLLTVPNGRKDMYEGHINFWSPESWKVFLENNSNGLSVQTGIVESSGLFGIINK